MNKKIERENACRGPKRTPPKHGPPAGRTAKRPDVETWALGARMLLARMPRDWSLLVYDGRLLLVAPEIRTALQKAVPSVALAPDPDKIVDLGQVQTAA